MTADPAPRRLRWRRWTGVAAAALAAPLVAQGAAFVPGRSEPDPPTGDVGASRGEAEELPAAGNGIRWAFGPWRTGGRLALDLRSQRNDEGLRTRQTLLSADMQFASYVWQPWFLRLGAAAGVIVAHSRARSGDAATDAGGAGSSGSSVSMIGGLQLSLFPVSRFPFQAQIDVSDSRANNESLVTDYRTYRLGLSQSYRPMQGNESYSAQFDVSRLRTSTGINDSLAVLRGSAVTQWDDHALDLGASFSLNTRSDGGGDSRTWLATARHAFTPDSALTLDSNASWNRQRLAVLPGQPGVETDLLQVSTIANWRPREGDWLYSATAPTSLVATARLAESSSGIDGQGTKARTASVSAGLSKDFSREWRASGGLSYASFAIGDQPTVDLVAANAIVGYTPTGVNFGEWLYRPAASAGASLTDSSTDRGRQLLNVQGSHGLGRTWTFGVGSSVSLQVSQAASISREMVESQQAHGLSHAAAVSWQSMGDGRSQTHASLSVSDSRSRGEGDGHFQMLNLQLTRQASVTRYRNWSASLTAQMSRSSSDLFDAFSGELRREDTGWQRYYSGGVSYTDQRFMDIPRLRLTATLSANSQQLERRSRGDLNAPLEQVSESAEARLDYRIGLLDTQFSARILRVEGRVISSIAARAQRRF